LRPCPETYWFRASGTTQRERTRAAWCCRAGEPESFGYARCQSRHRMYRDAPGKWPLPGNSENQPNIADTKANECAESKSKTKRITLSRMRIAVVVLFVAEN
jgi:hypothetical protein